jgi:hypothetical protein
MTTEHTPYDSLSNCWPGAPRSFAVSLWRLLCLILLLLLFTLFGLVGVLCMPGLVIAEKVLACWPTTSC